MKPIVKAKLNDIFNYPFFSQVGQPVPNVVTKVENWSQASIKGGSLRWKNSKLQARNAVQSGITDQFPKPGMSERMQEWNPLCEELRPIILSFVEELVERIPLENKDRKGIRGGVSWDLLLVCLECHYQDIVEPRFYIPYLDYWYAAGHYPCGWDGEEFPEQWDGVVRDGKLIVF